jgi:hypothetical protein
MSVPTPKVDPLAVRDDPATPRALPDLVAGVMELRDCARPAAKRYIERVGPERAENELRARWSDNGENEEGRE